MDYLSLKSVFDTEGYVVVRNFLSGEALQDLQQNLTRYIQEIVPTLPESETFYDDRAKPETLKQLNRMQQDAYFHFCSGQPTWKLLAESLLGETAEAHGVEWFNKPPGTNHPTPPHQDNYYFCLKPPLVLTMWLALDVIDEENGCLRYVPKSHLTGVRTHDRTHTLGFSQGISDYGENDLANEVMIHAQPGDLLVHHGNTIHRADPNRSATRHRRSFAMVFQGSSASRDERAFERYQQSASSQHQQLGVI